MTQDDTKSNRRADNCSDSSVWSLGGQIVMHLQTKRVVSHTADKQGAAEETQSPMMAFKSSAAAILDRRFNATDFLSLPTKGCNKIWRHEAIIVKQH